MATTYELSYFETDTGLSGTTFVYGFDALTADDVKIIGYIGTAQTDLSPTIATVNTTTKTLTLTTAPTAYNKIRIFRSTTVLPLVDFTSGAVLSEDALNTAYRHSLFAAQEVAQDASNSSNRSVIFTADINNGAITTDKLGIDSVTTTKIADDTIATLLIQDLAVTTGKLANTSVTSAKLASDSVTTAKILDENVTAAKLANTLDLSAKNLIIPDSQNPFAKEYFFAIDQKAQGTAGGAATAATTVTRTLNVQVGNVIVGASLNANQITLPVGTYYTEFRAPAISVGAHACWLNNNTAGSVAVYGSSEFTSVNASCSSVGFGEFTLTTPSVLELKHYTTAARATDGLGAALNLTGRPEFYSSVKIWKTA
jgi:hypothetical protein